MLLSEQFPHSDNLIYLNHAAVGPWPHCTHEAIVEFSKQNLSHGAKKYPEWLQVEHTLRQQFAQLINADNTDCIALQKNTSEALSVIAYGIKWQAGDNVVLAKQEFPSNRIVWESLRKFGVEIRMVDIADTETPETRLIAAIDRHTKLLTSSSVHYASGIKIDLQQLGEYCQKHEILFCVDAIQSLGAFPFDVQTIQADFVVADGHKWMLGPEGLALFYCREALIKQLELHQYGWHMVEHMNDYDRMDWRPAKSARRFECGSPNMIGIHALSASLKLLLEVGLDTISNNILNNVKYLLSAIQEIDNITILSPQDSARLAGIVNFRCNEKNNTLLHQYLMDHNIICALRGGGIRFSPHFYNTEMQLEQAIKTLKEGIHAI